MISIRPSSDSYRARSSRSLTAASNYSGKVTFSSSPCWSSSVGHVTCIQQFGCHSAIAFKAPSVFQNVLIESLSLDLLSLILQAGDKPHALSNILSPASESNIFRVIIVHKFFFIVADAKLRKFFDYANSFKEFVYRILMLIII